MKTLPHGRSLALLAGATLLVALLHVSLWLRGASADTQALAFALWLLLGAVTLVTALTDTSFARDEG